MLPIALQLDSLGVGHGEAGCVMLPYVMMSQTVTSTVPLGVVLGHSITASISSNLAPSSFQLFRVLGSGTSNFLSA